MIKGKPFVKWAGGKRQIINELKKYVPESFDTYYEPFVGGGALLFKLIFIFQTTINIHKFFIRVIYNSFFW